LADIEAQLDGSGNFVDVLAAGADANEGHYEFGIWMVGKCYLQNSLCCSRSSLSLDEEGRAPAALAARQKACGWRLRSHPPRASSLNTDAEQRNNVNSLDVGAASLRSVHVTTTAGQGRRRRPLQRVPPLPSRTAGS
jgi:hypothetical protein